MNISELISRLEEIQDQEGDLSVCYKDMSGNLDVDYVDVIEMLGHRYVLLSHGILSSSA